jgi:hypothetical protein
MSYIFESKRDLLYFKNYVALSKAIEQAGGRSDLVIKECENMLDNLARNNIELNPKYLGPEEI